MVEIDQMNWRKINTTEAQRTQPSWLDLLAGTKMVVFQILRKPQNYESLVARRSFGIQG